MEAAPREPRATARHRHEQGRLSPVHGVAGRLSVGLNHGRVDRGGERARELGAPLFLQREKSPPRHPLVVERRDEGNVVTAHRERCRAHAGFELGRARLAHHHVGLVAAHTLDRSDQRPGRAQRSGDDGPRRPQRRRVRTGRRQGRKRVGHAREGAREVSCAECPHAHPWTVATAARRGRRRGRPSTASRYRAARRRLPCR